jgi:hypothetical protein
MSFHNSDSRRPHAPPLRNIPPNYTLSIVSDSNATSRNVPGPGRILDNLLSSTGARVAKGFDRLYTWLGRGPHMAAHRLSTELRRTHAQGKRCTREKIKDLRDETAITHQLIWVCNGICSHCSSPYVPEMLTSISTKVQKELQEIAKYLRSVKTPYRHNL